MDRKLAGSRETGSRHPPNELLRAARESRAWTQAELAERVATSMKRDGRKSTGLNANYIYKWEVGRAKPGGFSRRHLERVFGMSAVELGFAESPDSAPSFTTAEPEILDEPEEVRTDLPIEGVAASLEPRSETHGPHKHTRRYALIAVAAALVACLWAGMAVFQIGPYSKPEIVISIGTVPKPAPSGSPHGGSQNTEGTEPTSCPTVLDKSSETANTTVLMDVADKSEPCWTQELSPVNPGTVLDYLITYRNNSSTVKHDVVMRANLAPGLDLISGTTFVFNSVNPHGIQIPDNDIVKGGVDVGSYDGDSTAYVRFAVTTPSVSKAACGWTTLTSVGVAHVPAFDEIYNAATASMYKSC
jgi:transcriptional regulator with XRE-family HTH domain